MMAWPSKKRLGLKLAIVLVVPKGGSPAAEIARRAGLSSSRFTTGNAHYSLGTEGLESARAA